MLVWWVRLWWRWPLPTSCGVVLVLMVAVIVDVAAVVAVVVCGRGGCGKGSDGCGL